MENPHLIKYVIVFPEDIIMKLTPWPLCNNLTVKQLENFAKDYSNKKQVRNIWNYAFQNFDKDDWKKDGGCVIVPQCSQCTSYGCLRHIKQNLENDNWPTHIRPHHTCKSDKNCHVALLSSEQMIVHQFLKTQSIQQMKLQTNDEQLISNVMNQVQETETETQYN